jgi:L-ribulose-5-phosphate 3-epimerase
MVRASHRRRFLTSTAALAALAALRPRLSLDANVSRTAIPFSVLPAERTILERFRLAADAGFSGVEMRALEDPEKVNEVREAAQRSNVRIHSVVDAASRRFPLSSADPELVQQGVERLQRSLRHARIWRADAVVIAPAAAGMDTSYRDAWNRSQTVIREQVLPLARELGVVLAVEEVWDGVVLGPPEVARYVDAFASPWVKASFDTSRGVFYSQPQDWIRTLGSRLVNVRLHSMSVDWVEVRRALDEIAYDGWWTAEIAGNDAASLEDVSTALRRHLNA